MCGYTGHFLFTVANDPFTEGNCVGAGDRTFPRYIYHGKYRYVKKSKETAHDIKLGKKLGFSIPKQNNHQVSSK